MEDEAKSGGVEREQEQETFGIGVGDTVTRVPMEGGGGGGLNDKMLTRVFLPGSVYTVRIGVGGPKCAREQAIPNRPQASRGDTM